MWPTMEAPMAQRIMVTLGNPKLFFWLCSVFHYGRYRPLPDCMEFPKQSPSDRSVAFIWGRKPFQSRGDDKPTSEAHHVKSAALSANNTGEGLGRKTSGWTEHLWERGIHSFSSVLEPENGSEPINRGGARHMVNVCPGSLPAGGHYPTLPPDWRPPLLLLLLVIFLLLSLQSFFDMLLYRKFLVFVNVVNSASNSSVSYPL